MSRAMTPGQLSQEREAFEAWAKVRYKLSLVSLRKKTDGRYQWFTLEDRFSVWLARASQNIPQFSIGDKVVTDNFGCGEIRDVSVEPQEIRYLVYFGPESGDEFSDWFRPDQVRAACSEGQE